MKSKLLIVLILLGGCHNPDAPEIVARNKQTLSGDGFLVGTLPDGRNLYRYEIDRGVDQEPHFIYICRNSISTNHEDSGKGNDIHTEVIIDNIPYVPKHPER